MSDDVLVTDLVTRARTGDRQAWHALIERYAPLVWAICRRYQLNAADAQDAGQAVWLHLVEQLGSLRDPAALPGWLATTTPRECARVLGAAHRPQAATLVPDAGDIADEQAPIPEQELLAAERHAALREAFTCLPPRGQQLLTLLTCDPPVPYAQISATLGIPAGSIGPLRGRYLHKLRNHPAIAALINADAASVADQRGTGDQCYSHERGAREASGPSAQVLPVVTELGFARRSRLAKS
jgi:RNA polymerase sigma factor (sigma-70 family)